MISISSLQRKDYKKYYLKSFEQETQKYVHIINIDVSNYLLFYSSLRKKGYKKRLKNNSIIFISGGNV